MVTVWSDDDGDDTELKQCLSRVRIPDADLERAGVSRESTSANLKLARKVCARITKPAADASGADFLRYFYEVEDACDAFNSGAGLSRAGSLVVLAAAARQTMMKRDAMLITRAVADCPDLAAEGLDNLKGITRTSLDNYSVEQIRLNVSRSTLIRPLHVLSTDPSFASDMNSDQCCVVDRTFYIPYFLLMRHVLILRPRRFGKTYWLNVLQAFFTREAPFIHLAVDRMAFRIGSQTWNPKQDSRMPEDSFRGCPVLFFDFSAMGPISSPRRLEAALLTICTRVAAANNVVLSTDVTTWDMALWTIIRMLSANGSNLAHDTGMVSDVGMNSNAQFSSAVHKRVVVLVDEYDKWLSHFYGTEHYDRVREIMAAFFSILKSMSSSILLTVVTGVTRWQLANLNSGPNHLIDLTLDPNLSQLFGFTYKEVRTLVATRRLPVEVLDMLVQNCDGYCFNTESTAQTVFCPFYVAQALATGQGVECWYLSGPSLVQEHWALIKNLRIPTTLSLRELTSADPTSTNAAAALFYLGYVTIKKVIGDGPDRALEMRWPNKGIENSVSFDVARERAKKQSSKIEMPRRSRASRRVRVIF